MNIEEMTFGQYMNKIKGLVSEVSKIFLEIDEAYKNIPGIPYTSMFEFRCDDITVRIHSEGLYRIPTAVEAVLASSCDCIMKDMIRLRNIYNEELTPEIIHVNIHGYMYISVRYISMEEWEDSVNFNIAYYSPEHLRTVYYDKDKIMNMKIRDLVADVKKKYEEMAGVYKYLEDVDKAVVNLLKLHIRIFECVKESLKDWRRKISLLLLYP